MSLLQFSHFTFRSSSGIALCAAARAPPLLRLPPLPTFRVQFAANFSGSSAKFYLQQNFSSFGRLYHKFPPQTSTREFRTSPSPRIPPLVIIPVIKLGKVDPSSHLPSHYRFIHSVHPLSSLPQIILAIWNAVSVSRASKIQDDETREARRKRIKLIVRSISAICIAGAVVFAAANIEQTPITNRWRVLSSNFEEDLDRSSSDQLLEEHKDHILSARDPVYLRVHNVVSRLLEAACSQEQLESLGVPLTGYICKNASKVPWRLAVIDRKDIANACVTADGTIVFFTGLLPLLADEKNGDL